MEPYLALQRQCRLYLIAKQLFSPINFHRMDKDQVNRVIEGLQSDLKTLILETRKKYSSVKEVKTIDHIKINASVSS